MLVLVSVANAGTQETLDCATVCISPDICHWINICIDQHTSLRNALAHMMFPCGILYHTCLSLHVSSLILVTLAC